MWRDILMSNREEILKQSPRFRHTLDAIEHVMRGGNAEALEDLIRHASDARADWQMQSQQVALIRRRTHRRPMYSIPHLDLPPLAAAGGRVRLPGSKSISNRVLLLAGLAGGCTRVQDLLDSDDTRVMVDALRALGCRVERDAGDARVTGLGGRLATRAADLVLGNAGTAMRPLAAALALLATTQGGRFRLAGVARMHERPIGDLVDALRPLGCQVGYLGTPGFPPLEIGDGAAGTLALGAPIHVRGDVSSQFVSALLLALPLVAARDIVVEVDGELISKPYVEITLNLLARFGVDIARDGWQRFTIPAGSRFRSPGEIHVEGDASAASYFIALGAVGGHGGRSMAVPTASGSIRSRATSASSTRRARWAPTSPAAPTRLEVRRGAWPLKALTLDCNHIPMRR